jgi:hypothetical protein
MVKETAALTPAQEKLLDAAVAIRQDPDAAEAAYMARHLTLCTLPHSDPGDVRIWTRANKNVYLGVQPGYDLQTGLSFGVPYGAIPRLLLLWLTTEVVRTRKRRLELGDNLAGFMRQLGMNPMNGTGKRSDAHRLREQMHRLFAAKISFQRVIDADGLHGERNVNMDVADAHELWWSPKKPGQATLWGSWVELGEKFYKALLVAPVPTDMRIIRAVKNSPLALDLLVWSGYQAFIAAQQKVLKFIAWTDLMQQLGCDYADFRSFKKRALPALRKIQAAYPGLKVATVKGGFIILPTSTPTIPSVAR